MSSSSRSRVELGHRTLAIENPASGRWEPRSSRAPRRQAQHAPPPVWPPVVPGDGTRAVEEKDLKHVRAQGMCYILCDSCLGHSLPYQEPQRVNATPHIHHAHAPAQWIPIRLVIHTTLHAIMFHLRPPTHHARVPVHWISFRLLIPALHASMFRLRPTTYSPLPRAAPALGPTLPRQVGASSSRATTRQTLATTCPRNPLTPAPSTFIGRSMT